MTFLNDVLEIKAREVEALRLSRPRPVAPRGGFADALREPGLAVIAEIKRRSPSKGSLAEGVDAPALARSYARGGAAAISCLTERTFFGAQGSDLKDACGAGLPVLRKDFIIDEVQVDESAALGASAVLLIVRILDPLKLRALLRHAESLGLEALVEVHDGAEIAQAIGAGASIVGINNRDLGTLEVDPLRAHRLRSLIPRGILSVAESGVKSREDVQSIEEAGFDAVLIGETLVKSADPAATLRSLTGAAEEAL
jgi:indole-3-glycerol phosphate synthase